MTSSLLEARAVTKRFPGVVALNNVSLSVAEGEALALIGENGAGKSTLMKILAGIQQPDEGEIRWRGDATSIRSVQNAMNLGRSFSTNFSRISFTCRDIRVRACRYLRPCTFF